MRTFLLLIAAVTTPVIASSETLRGAVKDASDTPLSGAMVLIHWDRAGATAGVRSNIGIDADLSTVTKEDGTFTADLAPGFYDVFVAATAFTPTCRKIRIKAGEPQEIRFRLNVDDLYTVEMGGRVEAMSGFSHATPGHVPEGKAIQQRGLSTAEQCESACAAALTCKAYAFDTVNPACYFYSEVFMGGTPESRRLGQYSSGLAILPKTGFICAFKRSSFPPPPVPVQPPK
jgi:hypothetical protein